MWADSHTAVNKPQIVKHEWNCCQWANASATSAFVWAYATVCLIYCELNKDVLENWSTFGVDTIAFAI